MKVLILGSNGLVGSSLGRILDNNQKITELIASTRKDTSTNLGKLYLIVFLKPVIGLY